MGSSLDPTGIDRVLREGVEKRAVPQVVGIVADRDGVIYEGAAGPRVAGSDEMAGTDSVFAIMSMTKMVVTVAALQQVERGTLDLDAPIDTYRPEFADVQVLDGFDGDTPLLRTPASRATVRQLITHTTGLGYWFWNEDQVRYERIMGLRGPASGRSIALTSPLLADPGTRFSYGINTDWLGLVVEVAAGKTLDIVVKEDITGPLGMDDTAFVLTDAQRSRLVRVHIKNDAGGWTDIDDVVNRTDPEWWAGGHGLYSTPRDYIRFERMLLGGGELDGVRILSEQTVDDAFRNQIGDLDFPASLPTADPVSSGPLNVGPGYKWGYGLLINTMDVPGRRRAGSGAWAGLYNTHFWIDRAGGLCASIYSNSLPFITDEAFGLYGDFEEAVYAAR